MHQEIKIKGVREVEVIKGKGYSDRETQPQSQEVGVTVEEVTTLFG